MPESIPIYYTPKGLLHLCFTEFWERFGFYLVQALFVLYLTKAFGFSDRASYSLLGSFITLCYITPVVGGYLADNWLGYGVSIFMGAGLMALGYFLLAIPSLTLLYFALALIVVGNGFFKPNVTSLLGRLYSTAHTVERDIGFTYFYMGINLGAFCSTLLAGILMDTLGWGASFASAGFGLLIATWVFIYGLRYYRAHTKKRGEIHIGQLCLLLVGVILSLFLVTLFLIYAILSTLLFVVSAFLLLFFIYRRSKAYDAPTQRNIWACYVLILLGTTYWIFDFQIYFSMTLFINRVVDRKLWSLTVPTPFFISVLTFFIIVFGFTLNKLWHYLEKVGKNPSPLKKLTLGMGCAAACYALLLIGIKTSGGEVSMLWPVLGYALMACGEILTAPVSYSLTTRLMPRKLVAMTIGAWFIYCGGCGGKVTSWLAQIAAVPKQVIALGSVKSIYFHAFFIYFACTLILAVIFMLITPRLHRLLWR